MKSIATITRRLISLFLVVVASSMMFLSSPVIAVTTSSVVSVTDETFPKEVIEFSKNKPVIAILESIEGYTLKEAGTEIEKVLGDKYKIVIGKEEENEKVFSKFVRPSSFDMIGVHYLFFKNGNLLGRADAFTDDFTKEAEALKMLLAKMSF